eukprot:1848304-Lingulodinium_polyedra.AAC.1
MAKPEQQGAQLHQPSGGVAMVLHSQLPLGDVPWLPQRTWNKQTNIIIIIHTHAMHQHASMPWTAMDCHGLPCISMHEYHALPCMLMHCNVRYDDGCQCIHSHKHALLMMHANAFKACQCMHCW